ncbi:CcdC protein domain-containing protein [Neobacillus sp. D3-1R]|uniref:CcdC protein domain-containing protein n=1 Tax=Neobacillus sp. D3-1R TaxID=3445778 RepID=UPI003F9F3F14
MNYNPILYIIILVAAFIFYRQVLTMYKPIKGKGIRIISTLFLLTPGYSLIMNPKASASSLEVAIAIVVGLIMSIPLIVTTDYERRIDGKIYVKKSMLFVILFVLLFALRWTVRGLLDMDSDTCMMLFFITACSYLLPWKLSSFYKFRKVYSSKSDTNNSHHITA